MDLAREILFAIENYPEPRDWVPIEKEGTTKKEISYHVKLLDQAGLIEPEDVSTMGKDGFEWKAKSLTWEGHEFLEAARDNNRWNKTKKLILEKSGGLIFEVLKRVSYTGRQECNRLNLLNNLFLWIQAKERPSPVCNSLGDGEIKILIESIIFLVFMLLPAGWLLRDWKFSDKRTRKYRNVTGSLLIIWIIFEVLSAYNYWDQRKDNENLKNQVNELISGKNELLKKSTDLATQINEYQNEIRQKDELQRGIRETSQNNSFDRRDY